MGSVFVAEQLSTGSKRAVKLMHAGLVGSPALRARFEQEARVSAQIPSDHVVQVIAAGIDETLGVPWLAMELLEGSDLQALVDEQGPPPPEMRRQLFMQLSHALSAAHDQNIVHRDLKPENIFVAHARSAAAPFHVKVLDFGIAKVLGSASASTAALGTPLYMAPEQAESSRKVGPHTDVWALGLVAFFVLTGRHYWLTANNPEGTTPELMREVLFDPLPAPEMRAKMLGVEVDFPPGFREWFHHCLERDTTRRYASAKEACRVLDQVLELAMHAPAAASKPSASSKPISAPARSEPARSVPARSVPKTEPDVPPLKVPLPGTKADAETRPRAVMADSRNRYQPPPAVTPAQRQPAVDYGPPPAAPHYAPPPAAAPAWPSAPQYAPPPGQSWQQPYAQSAAAPAEKKGGMCSVVLVALLIGVSAAFLGFGLWFAFGQEEPGARGPNVIATGKRPGNVPSPAKPEPTPKPKPKPKPTSDPAKDLLEEMLKRAQKSASSGVAPGAGLRITCLQLCDVKVDDRSYARARRTLFVPSRNGKKLDVYVKFVSSTLIQVTVTSQDSSLSSGPIMVQTSTKVRRTLGTSKRAFTRFSASARTSVYELRIDARKRTDALGTLPNIEARYETLKSSKRK